MIKSKLKVIVAVLLAACLLLSVVLFSTACGEQTVKITVWNYYNSDQLTSFNKLVEEFNKTVGAENGIVVESQSQGSINVLSDQLLEAVEHKSGAQEMPNLAAVYSESAYLLEAKDALAAFDEYFTADELNEYIPACIEEGRLVKDGPLYLMPVSKSTEVVAYNVTDWKPFEEDTGITIDSIVTIEDMVAAAKEYYEWSDGNALYGRDSLENYVYIGTAQLGHEMFKVNESGELSIDLDRDTFETLWNNYYTPMVKGYFYGEMKNGKSTYASDLAKFGKVLALTCSTSAMTYFPTEVISDTDEKHAVEAVVKKPLLFNDSPANAPKYVQQGAAYCMLKASVEEERASAQFLKWLTKKENNIAFALQSSYCPSKTESNNTEAIKAAFGEVNSVKANNILQSLTVSAEVLVSGKTYACKPFEGAKEVRSYLGSKLEAVTIEDCRKIEAAMETGVSREEALADSNNTHDFESWFDELQSHVNTLLKGK